MWFRFAIYKNAVLFFCTLALSAAATVAYIKIRYDAKTPQFAIFETRVICVFYSIVSLVLVWQRPHQTDVLVGKSDFVLFLHSFL